MVRLTVVLCDVVCNTILCVAIRCNIILCYVTLCSVVLGNAMRCAMQCKAVRCRLMWWYAISYYWRHANNVEQCDVAIAQHGEV